MMRTGELLRHLAAHRNSTDRLMARARTLSPEEVEASTDPEVLRIRRMALAVRGEVCRMRGFIRLRPLGERVLWGRISPHHDVGFEISDFFARRFPGKLIVLGDGRRSWTSLYSEGALHRQIGDGLSSTLADISRIMDLLAEGSEEEKGDGVTGADEKAEKGRDGGERTGERAAFRGEGGGRDGEIRPLERLLSKPGRAPEGRRETVQRSDIPAG
ncbi:MAG TPA: DUF4130 domain-containing protein [Methanothrix sp.]|jgi:hypothetical protein|nr:DUF4130 domain-containing protein [Methanothrix sp.]